MVPLHGSWANVESGKWNVLFCPSQAFLLAARALGANQILSGRVPDGLLDNNPAFQRRERVATGPSPVGTAELGHFGRPYGTCSLFTPNPALEAPGYCQMSLRDNPA